MFFGKRSNLAFLFIAVFLVLTVAAIVFICLFLPGSVPDHDISSDDPGIRVNFPDNGELLSLSSDLYFDYAHRYDPAKYDVLYGADISEWNKMEPDDWEDIKAAGIDFVFLRVGFRGYGETGNLLSDSCFQEYFQGAKIAGLKIGCYIYSQAVNRTEIREEAQLLLDALSGQPLDMPVVLDCEFASEEAGFGRLYNAHLSAEEYAGLCNYFAEIVRDAGYMPMLYGNTKMFNEYIATDLLDNDILLWVAQYYNNCQYVGDDYTFWQFTDSGEVDGVSQPMDFNFWYVPKTAFVDGEDRVACAIRSLSDPHPYESSAYTDVDVASPYYQAISFMSDAGMLYVDGAEYRQNQLATTHDLLYALYKLSWSGLPPEDWVRQVGLDAFAKDDPLDYGLMAQMCYQYLAAWDSDFQTSKKERAASQDNRYLTWMIERGIMFEQDADPEQKISRGEYAVLLMDFYRHVGFCDRENKEAS